MTVYAALTQLKSNINANLSASGQDSLVNAWVYPNDYAGISTTNLPVAIVMEKVAAPRQWGWFAYGTGAHKWEAEVFLLLKKAQLQGFNDTSAQVELLHQGWAKGMADVLAADITLTDNVRYVGNGEQGANGLLFEYTIEHIMWAQEVYWGIHFNIPITQNFTHVTG